MNEDGDEKGTGQHGQESAYLLSVTSQSGLNPLLGGASGWVRRQLRANEPTPPYGHPSTGYPLYTSRCISLKNGVLKIGGDRFADDMTSPSLSLSRRGTRCPVKLGSNLFTSS